MLLHLFNNYGLMSSNEKNGNIKPLVIFLAVLIGGIAYYMLQDEEVESIVTSEPKRLKGSIATKLKLNKDSPYSENGGLTPEQLAEREKKLIKFKSNPIIKTNLELKREKQSILRKEFKSLIKAEFEMPENLDYVTMDLDQEVAGVFGSGQGQIKTFTALAKKGNITQDMVLEFLNDSTSGLPFSGRAQFYKKPIMKINNPPGTGIKEVLVYESSSPAYKAAFLKRQDNLGSYVFILEADPTLYNSNEGYLDRLLQSFKATGP